MKPFSVIFQESGKNVIDYDGKIVFSCFKCIIPDRYIISLRSPNTNSPDRQLICISTNFDGSIKINGDTVEKKKGVFSRISVYSDDIKGGMSIEIDMKSDRFILYNASIPSDSEFTRSMVFGCAINPVRLDDGWFRINCNDHEIDDDFDDLVFEMKVENENGIVDIIEEWRPEY